MLRRIFGYETKFPVITATVSSQRQLCRYLSAKKGSLHNCLQSMDPWLYTRRPGDFLSSNKIKITVSWIVRGLLINWLDCTNNILRKITIFYAEQNFLPSKQYKGTPASSCHIQNRRTMLRLSSTSMIFPTDHSIYFWNVSEFDDINKFDFNKIVNGKNSILKIARNHIVGKESEK